MGLLDYPLTEAPLWGASLAQGPAPGPAQPPSSYAGITTALAVLMLVIEYGMLQATLLSGQIRLYIAQSLVISALAAVVAFARHVPELYALAALSLLLKVIIVVPTLMLRLLRRTDPEIAHSRALGVASMVLLAVAVSAFGFFASGRFGLGSPVLPATALAELKELLQGFPGEAEVVIELSTSAGPRRLKLGPEFRVSPGAGLNAELGELLGGALLGEQEPPRLAASA